MAIEAGTSTYYQAKRGIVQDGLVLHLDAGVKESYSGGDIWYDISGNNRNGVRRGSQKPAWYSGNGGYFSFTGGVTGNNYTRIEAANPTMTDMTIEVFYRPIGNGGTVFRQTNDDFHITGNRISAGNAYNDYVLYTSTNNGLNVWVYNAITWYNLQTLRFYKNGIQTASGNRSSQDSDGIAAGTIRIGTRNDAYSEHYIGDVSIFRMYNRTLSSDEISRNYNATRHRFGL
jgi:hypothetical protein